MDNGIVWGVPAQRTKKVEKYSFAVLTMSKVEEGSNRKISFNKAALALLNLVGGEDFIKVGFSGQQTFIAKGGENDIRVAKNNSFSDKRIFEYIAKLYSFDTAHENELCITAVFGQEGLFELTPFYGAKSLNVATEKAIENIASEELAVMNNPVSESFEDVVEDTSEVEDEVQEAPFELEEEKGIFDTEPEVEANSDNDLDSEW